MSVVFLLSLSAWQELRLERRNFQRKVNNKRALQSARPFFVYNRYNWFDQYVSRGLNVRTSMSAWGSIIVRVSGTSAT